MHSVQQLIERIQASKHKALDLFESLNEEQLNWKPDENSWSIAQCLHHLIVSNEKYFPVFEAIFAERYQSKWYQNLSGMNRFWAKQILSMTTPEPIRKIKSPPVFKPSSSYLPATIVTQFASHCESVMAYFDLLRNKPIDKITLSSPTAFFITYTVADAFLIITQHTERHLNQAERVMNQNTFPK